MAEKKEKEFCTILDKVDDKVLTLLTKLCMSSLLSRTDPKGKRTFLKPDSKLLGKLEKMKSADAKIHLRYHILRGNLTPKVVEAKTEAFKAFPVVKDMEYEVEKGKKNEMVVNGVVAKFVSSARNGSIWEVSEQLKPQERKKESPKREKGKRRKRSKKGSSSSSSRRRGSSSSSSRSRSRGSSSSRRKGSSSSPRRRGSSSSSRSRSRGSSSSRSRGKGKKSNEDYLDYNYEEMAEIAYPGMSGGGLANLEDPSELRFTIINDYQREFPLEQFPMGSDLNWANRALAALLLFGEEKYAPNFKKMYLPFLSSDPLATLEILLQLRDKPLELSKTILDTEFLLNFMNSSMYLNPATELLTRGQELLRGFCGQMDAPGLCPYETYYNMQPWYNTEMSYLRGLADIEDPMALRRGILAAYRKLSGEPNRYNPETVGIYKKVYGPSYGDAILRHDLMRYMVKLLHRLPYGQYSSIMDTLFTGPSSSVVENLLQPNLFPQEMFRDFMGTETFLHNFLLDMFGSSHLPPVFGLPSYSTGSPTVIDVSMSSTDPWSGYGMDYNYSYSGLSSPWSSGQFFSSPWSSGQYKPPLSADVVSSLFS